MLSVYIFIHCICKLFLGAAAAPPFKIHFGERPKCRRIYFVTYLSLTVTSVSSSCSSFRICESFHFSDNYYIFLLKKGTSLYILNPLWYYYACFWIDYLLSEPGCGVWVCEIMVQTFQSRKLSNLHVWNFRISYITIFHFIQNVFIVSILIQYPNENKVSISKGKQKVEIYEFIWEIIRPLIRGIHLTEH